MAGPSLGQAVVDIVADTTGFRDSLVKGIAPGLKELPKRTGASAKEAAQVAAKNIGDRSAQAGILKSARTLVARLVDPFKDAFKDIVALNRAMAPALSSSTTVRAFTQSAKIIGDAIAKQWGRLTGQIGKVTDKIVETSAKVWGTLSTRVTGIVRNLANSIGSSEIVSRVRQATSKVTGAISGAWTAVTDKLSGIVRGWSAIITKGRNWFFEAGTTVAANVVHAIQTTWSKTTSLARGLVDSISNSKAVGWFRNAATTIGSTVTTTLGNVWQKATNLTQTLVEKVSDSRIVGLFRTAASNLGNEFTRFIARPLNALGRIGQDMVSKLGGPKVLTAARNVGTSISNSIVGRLARRLLPGFSSAGEQAASSIGSGLAAKLPGVAGQAASAGSGIGSKLSGAISGGLGKSTGKLGILGPLFGGAGGPAGIAIGAAVGIATAGAAAIGTALTKGFGRLTSIENAEAKLLGLGNSTETVAVIMDSALKAVEGTVYSLADSATGAAAAVAAGVKPGKDLTRWLKLLADAAQMTGRPLADMGYVLNQVQTMGKVTGDVLFTLESAGLGVTQALAKQLGKSREETRKMVSEGKIDAATFQEVMEGMIGGAALKAGDTTTGAMQNIGNAISKLGASLLQGIFPYFRKFFLGIYDFLQLLAPQAKVFGAALGKSFEIIGKVVVGLAKGIAGGVQAVAGFLDRILGISDAVTRFKQSVSGPGLGALSDLRDAIATGVGPVVEKFRIGWAAIGTAIGKFADAARKVLAPFVKWIAEVFGQVWNGLMAGIREYMPQIKSLFSGVSSGISGLVDMIVPLINKATAALQKWFGENEDEIAEFTKVLGLVAKAVGIVTKHLVGLVVGALAGVFKVIGGIFTVLKGIFTGDGGMILKGFKQIFVDGIGGILKAAGDFVSKSIADIVKKILAAFNVDLGPTGKKILAGFQGGILNGFGTLGGLVGKQVGKIVKSITTGFGNAVNWAKSKWQAFTTWISKPFIAIVNKAKWVWDKLFGHSIFPDILNALKKWATNFTNAITGAWKKVTNAFNAGLSWVKGTFSKGWSKVTSIMSGAVTKGRDAVGKAWTKTREKFSAARTWVSSTWKRGWDNAKTWMSSAVVKGRDAIGTAWTKTREKFTAARTWVGSKWKPGWDKAKTWMATAVQKGRDAIGTALGNTGVRKAFNGLRSWAADSWKNRWNIMSRLMKDPVGEGRRQIASLLGRTGLQSVFSKAVTAIGKIWDRIKSKITAPIKWVIDKVINPGVYKGINTVLKWVGMEKQQLAWINTKGMAQGGVWGDSGVLPGYTPGRDVHRFYSPTGGGLDLSGGEAVMVPQFTNAVGGKRGVGALNHLARAGKLAGNFLGAFASGGVAPVPGRGNRHTSGYPWATWAGDFPQPMGTPIKAWKDGIVAMVKHLTTSYGQHVRVNHNDGTQSLYAHMSRILVAAGDKLTAGQRLGLVGSTGNSTGPHLHFETQGGAYKGGAGDTAAEANPVMETILGLGKKVSGLLKGLTSGFGTNPETAMLGKIPGALVGKAATKLKSFAANFLDTATGMISGATQWVGSKLGVWSGAQRNVAATVIDVARKLGFGDRGAIIGLITGIVESGLRNISYGDRDSVGVFQQRAPWGSFADRTNVAKSASMFFNGGQGGQPGLRSKPWKTMGLGQAAQAVQVSAFPGRYQQEVGKAQALLNAFGKGGIKGGVYDTGGWLPKGLSVAYNGTGQRERVTAPHQEPTQQPTIGTLNIELSLRDLEQMRTLEDFLRIVEKARVRGRTTARSGTVSAG